VRGQLLSINDMILGAPAHSDASYGCKANFLCYFAV